MSIRAWRGQENGRRCRLEIPSAAFEGTSVIMHLAHFATSATIGARCRMSRRNPTPPKSAIPKPEKVAGAIIGILSGCSVVAGGLPVNTFWYRFAVLTLFAVFLIDISLRSTYARQRVPSFPGRICISIVMVASLVAIAWNPMRKLYMLENLGPSVAFVFGAPLGDNDSSSWVMAVGHYGPNPAYNCDLVFYDLARQRIQQQWINEHPGVLFPPQELVGASKKELPHIPELDPSPHIDGYSFNWDPIDPDNHHYRADINCRDGNFHEEWDVERLNGRLRTSVIIDADDEWLAQHPDTDRRLFTCADPQFSKDFLPITSIPHRTGVYPGWQANHLYRPPVLIIAPDNSLRSMGISNGMGCWDILNKHFGDPKLPFSFPSESTIYLAIIIYGFVIMVLTPYFFLADWWIRFSERGSE